MDADTNFKGSDSSCPYFLFGTCVPNLIEVRSHLYTRVIADCVIHETAYFSYIEAEVSGVDSGPASPAEKD